MVAMLRSHVIRSDGESDRQRDVFAYVPYTSPIRTFGPLIIAGPHTARFIDSVAGVVWCRCG